MVYLGELGPVDPETGRTPSPHAVQDSVTGEWSDVPCDCSPETGETKLPGPVEQSVWADIERVGKTDVGVRGSLKEMALKLARAFDLCETDDITALAKLNAELRQTLARLTDVGSDDQVSIASVLRALSTPKHERCPECGYKAAL